MTELKIINVFPNVVVFSNKCPKCGDNLIGNHTGIECGAIHCDYNTKQDWDLDKINNILEGEKG